MSANEPLVRFRELFRGRESHRGRYRDGDDATKRVWTQKGAATDDEWEAHLKGEGPYLGLNPLTTENACLFAAIDYDDEGVDLGRLATQVKDLGLPLVVCRSKSGGAHLYVFFKEPVPGKQVVEHLKRWRTAMGVEENADGREVEIFPKQTRLKPKEPGNWINLPYYGTDETNRFAVLADGTRLNLTDFLDLAERRRITAEQLENIVLAGDALFDEGPPCLQTLHQLGYPAGTRNQGLYNVGCFFKLAHPEAWREKLEEYNYERMDPALPAVEVAALVKSLERRDYVYKCEELPIQPHCRKAECKRRRFGIAGFQRQRDEEHFPDLAGLTKILTDPPRWTLEVNDEVVELTTDDLMSLTKFRKICLEQLSIIVPNLKARDWDEKLRLLLTNQTVIEAPEDAGVLGQFKHLVGEFLLMRLRATSREDLLMGKPYEEDGKVYFRSVDLTAFLERRRFKDYEPAKLYMALRHMGAGHTQFNMKGACVQAWWLPVPDNEQREDFDDPLPSEPEF